MSDFRRESNEALDDGLWFMGKAFLKIVLPIIGASMVIGGIYWGCNLLSTPAQLIDKTMNPDNIIFNYEYFKQAHQDILALDSKIVEAQLAAESAKTDFGSRKEMDREDKIELARLNAIVQGLKQERATEVATYNARAKMLNRDLFRSKDLPSHID